MLLIMLKLLVHIQVILKAPNYLPKIFFYHIPVDLVLIELGVKSIIFPYK